MEPQHTPLIAISPERYPPVPQLVDRMGALAMHGREAVARRAYNMADQEPAVPTDLEEWFDRVHNQVPFATWADAAVNINNA